MVIAIADWLIQKLGVFEYYYATVSHDSPCMYAERAFAIIYIGRRIE
jgi:hypothetical protein